MNMRDKIDSHQGFIVNTNQQGQVVLDPEEFTELITLAHEAVHPENTPGTNTWESASDAFGPDEAKSDELDPQIRNVAMHYSVTLISHQIDAAHGLEVTPDRPVALAEEILAFLKG